MGWFANLRLSRKLLSVFSVIILLVVSLGGISLLEISKLGQATDDLAKNWMPSVNAARKAQYEMQAQRTVLYQLITSDSAEDIAKFAERIEMYDKRIAASLAESKQLSSSPAEAQLVADVVAMRGDFDKLMVQILALAKANKDAEALVITSGPARELALKIAGGMDKLVEQNEKGADASTAQADAVRGSAGMVVFGLLALVALLAVVGGLMLQRGIGGPVIAMTDAMRRLAGGDKTVDIPATGRSDEVGQMADAVEVFKQTAIEQDRLAAEQEAARAERERRAAAIEALTRNFDAKVSGVLEIVTAACTEMDATAQALSANAEQTSRQSAVVAAATEEASASVQTVASAAEELAASVNEIGRQVAHASEVSIRTEAEAERAETTVKGLAANSARIGEIVNLINDIASQTNLLALNATIEAARAGDAGKGFAVVAGEVKNLASQTGRATGEIGAQIGAVQSATQEVVSAIAGVVASIGEIREVSTAIAAAVEQQAAAAAEIARNVQQAAAGTQEVASNIEGVNQAAGETGSASQQVLEASRSLSTEAVELKTVVQDFLVGVRTA
jgi:methyl-accepting chemotaxis protein